MKILALEKEIPGRTSTDFQPHLRAEAQRVWELQKSGIIRDIYFTRETHEAVLVLECDSKASAIEFLHSLPLVHNNLISFEIFILEPYTGFDRLLEKDTP